MQLNKTFYIDSFGYGVGLWLIGYVISIILFMLVPQIMLGWLTTLICLPITIFLALKRFRNTKQPINYYVVIGVIWLLIAVIFDYLFIVTLFHSTNYYQIDIAFYYTVTLVLPIIIGYRNNHKTLV